MKIRIGISHPLPPQGEALTVVLPRHIERNYDIPAGVQHSVWIDASGDIKGKIGGIAGAAADEGQTRLSGQISEEELTNSGELLLSGGAPQSHEVPDLLEPEKYAIVQTIAEVAQAAPKSLIIVLDSSLAAKPHMEKLVEACRELPDGMKMHFVPASDDIDDNAAMPKKGKFLTPSELAVELQRVQFQGGQDNLPALKHAWQQALDEPGTAVVWIHGPQAVQLTPPDDLIQLFERSGKTMPAFYEVLLAPGPDRIVGAIERYVDINYVSGVGNSALVELASLFSKWKTGKPQQELVRTRRELSPGDLPASATRAGGHLARLWSFGEAMQLFRDQTHSTNARTLAVKYQLVTPFTGAVVLETEEQYKDAGLKPVEPGTVPTIPEPEEWALIFVAFALLACGIWKSRRLTGGRTYP